MTSSESAVWLIYMAPALLVVLLNAHSLWTIRAARKQRLPVASCRPLAVSLLVADLFRGTSGLCQALFALLTSTDDALPGEHRLCRILALTQQWTSLTTCSLTTLFFYEGMARTRDPSVYFRRVRVTAVVGAAGFHGFVTSFLPIAGWGSYAHHPQLNVCEIDSRRSIDYQLFLVCIGSLLPWLSGVIVYVMILVGARRRARHVSPARDLHGPDYDASARVVVSRKAAGRVFAIEESFEYSGRRCAIIFAAFCISGLENVAMRLLHMRGIFGRLATGGLCLYVAMATVGLITSLVNPVALVGNPLRRCHGNCAAGKCPHAGLRYRSSTPDVDSGADEHGDGFQRRGCLGIVARCFVGNKKVHRPAKATEVDHSVATSLERY